MSADMLPANATAQERGLSTAVARLGEIPVPIGDLWNPWKCPAPLLPWLAWALSVDVWDDSWSEEQKRATIAASVQVHRIKGTRGALAKSLKSLEYETTIIEWFHDSPKRAPFTFRVSVSVGAHTVDASFYSLLKQVINRAKNTRSHLASISVCPSPSGGLHRVRGFAGLFPAGARLRTRITVAGSHIIAGTATLVSTVTVSMGV